MIMIRFRTALVRDLTRRLRLLRVWPRTCKLQMSFQKHTSSYEEAIKALNSLQTNVEVLKNAQHGKKKDIQNLIDTSDNLRTLGIESEDLDSLNIIHVSGTKGKGSTCAFAESILRHHGIKTGFYSSPHLISVTERIRINGDPINKAMFTFYFWEVFDGLQQNLSSDDKMPSYFHFLTLLAFYIFVKEKIEAAVIEVGIGGLYDCTNVVRNPVVVGVSTLGFDHMHMLGNTIPLIAAQKAGIFKPGVPSFTVPQEEEAALSILQEKANTVGCPLFMSPPLETYLHEHSTLNLGIPGKVQSINASLALQLTHSWLKKKNNDTVDGDNTGTVVNGNVIESIPLAPPFSLTSEDCQGLESCVWLGRFQTLKKNHLTFYLDGAHTMQSMRHCTRWFAEVSQKEEEAIQEPVCRILIFNCTGTRNPEVLLNIISDLHFDLALFTTNIISMNSYLGSDHTNVTVSPSCEIKHCKSNQEVWTHMMRSYQEGAIFSQATPSMGSNNSSKYYNPDNSLAFACVRDVCTWLIYGKSMFNRCHYSDISEAKEYADLYQILKGSKHCQILVTGSIHLVGNVLNVINNLEV